MVAQSGTPLQGGSGRRSIEDLIVRLDEFERREYLRLLNVFQQLSNDPTADSEQKSRVKQEISELLLLHEK